MDVVHAAVQEFNIRGFEATTMGHVAKRLSISKPALYHHIGSKEEILEETVGRALDSLEGVWEEIAEKQAPAVDRLRLLIDGSIHVMSEYPEAVALLVRLRGNSPVEEKALRRRRAITRDVIALVVEAQENGEIRTDIDARTIGRMLFGLINSVAEWFEPGGRLSAEEVSENVCAMVFNGICKVG